MNTRLISRDEYPVIAHFIAQLNQERQHHIGECSTKNEELLAMLNHDITAPSPDKCFVLLEIDGSLVGVLGMDGDSESGKGYLWGPFIFPEYGLNELQVLWKAFLDELPQQFHELHLFYNSENKRVDQFVKAEWGKPSDSEHLILGLTQTSFRDRFKGIEQSSHIQSLSPTYEEAVLQLHNETFPNTYLPGQEMIASLGKDDHYCYIYTLNNTLLGYVYFVAEPDYASGSVEYIAVSKQHRGQGIGKLLLQHALQRLFSYPEIKDLRLTVSAKEKGTIGLYQSVGFTISHTMKAVTYIR